MGLLDVFSSGSIKAVGGIIDELHTSTEEKEQLKLRFAEVEAKLKAKQMDINLADAQSTASGLSGFMQRSWRPLIGMSAAIAIFWEFVLSKFILFFLGVFHYEVINIPQLDTGVLMTLVTSLLGLGTLRTFEKAKGLTR